MFVAIPYHPAIATDYSDLAKCIRKQGTNPGHTLAVISMRDHDEEAYLFSNSLTDYFGRHAKVTVDSGPAPRVVQSNRYFTAALNAFAKYKPGPKEAPNAPILFYDPAYRPQNPRWLDDLQTEYFLNGAPMVSGVFKDATPPSPIGPVIFSKSFLKKSALLGFMPPDVSWRDYLAWELVKNSVNAGGIGSHESAVLAPNFEV